MMSSIDDDYVKYVMHAQVQVMERPAIDPGLAGAQYLAPEGPVLGSQAIAGALLAGPAPGEEVVFASEDGEGAPADGVARVRTNGDGAGQPVRVPAAAVSEFDRAGRNDPCPCGSGKKFKFCHGK